jgi:hypothetical protein
LESDGDAQLGKSELKISYSRVTTEFLDDELAPFDLWQTKSITPTMLELVQAGFGREGEEDSCRAELSDLGVCFVDSRSSSILI